VKKAQKVQNWVAMVLSELAFGVLWAAILQHTAWGRRLAQRRTWITVVIGVAGTVLLAWPVLPIVFLWRITIAFCCSSVGIIARSLVNEFLTEKAIDG